MQNDSLLFINQIFNITLSHTSESIKDWPISSTPANVTIQSILHHLITGIGIVDIETVHGHDHARTAEPALGAVVTGQGVLDWVWVGFVAQTFHRGDGPTGAFQHWGDALGICKYVRFKIITIKVMFRYYLNWGETQYDI